MNTLDTRRVSSRGLTLIELVMVLIILGTVAGLVVPQVAHLGRTSDMAATSKTQADLASNIQMHFVQLKRFPQGMDSLLKTDGSLYLPEDLDSDGEQDTGLPDSGPHLDEQLEVIDLATVDTGDGTTFRRSMSRSGFDFVYDHDTSVLNANDSATTERDLGGSSSPALPVAAIATGTNIAKAVFASTDGVIPDDIKLVALGIGPNSTLLGKTSLNAPIYPGCDGSYYGRYVAIFKVYADGSRAQLAMVVDAYGRFPDYTTKQFNETLPEGARRG